MDKFAVHDQHSTRHSKGMTILEVITRWIRHLGQSFAIDSIPEHKSALASVPSYIHASSRNTNTNTRRVWRPAESLGSRMGVVWAGAARYAVKIDQLSQSTDVRGSVLSGDELSPATVPKYCNVLRFQRASQEARIV